MGSQACPTGRSTQSPPVFSLGVAGALSGLIIGCVIVCFGWVGIRDLGRWAEELSAWPEMLNEDINGTIPGHPAFLWISRRFRPRCDCSAVGSGYHVFHAFTVSWSVVCPPLSFFDVYFHKKNKPNRAMQLIAASRVFRCSFIFVRLLSLFVLVPLRAAIPDLGRSAYKAPCGYSGR